MKMPKCLVITAALVMGWNIASVCAQTEERYVRKPVQPNFFIPDGSLAQSRPEKVIIPRYGAGVSTAKHISREDDKIPQRTPFYDPRQQAVPQQPQTTDNAAQTVAQPLNKPQPTEQKNDNASVPPVSEAANYQEMYQSYLRDLEAIADTGKPASTNTISDLDAMNSEERIQLDKKFNERRNVDLEIQKALQ